METIGTLSSRYGIERTVLIRACEKGDVPAKLSEPVWGPRSVWMIDEMDTRWQSWLTRHFKRVSSNGLQEMAKLAQEHHLIVPEQGKHQAIRKPLEVLFQAIEHNPHDLDFARAAARGEIEKLIGHGRGIEQYVTLFFEVLLKETCHGSITTLFKRQHLFVAAYETYYQTNFGKEPENQETGRKTP